MAKPGVRRWLRSCGVYGIGLVATSAALASGTVAQQEPAGISAVTPVVFGGGVRFAGNGRSVRDRPSEGEYGFWFDLRMGNRPIQPWAEYTRSDWGGFTGGYRVQPVSGSASSYAVGAAVVRPLAGPLRLEAGTGLGYVDIHRSSAPADNSLLALARTSASLGLGRVFALRAGAQARYDSVYEPSLVMLYSAGLSVCLPRARCGSRRAPAARPD